MNWTTMEQGYVTLDVVADRRYPVYTSPALSEDFIRDRLGGMVDHVIDLGQALVGDELLPHAGIAMDFLTQEGATRVLPQMVLQVQTRLPELRVTAAYAIGGVVIIQVVEA